MIHPTDIKARISLQTVLEYYGIKLLRNRCKCFIHNGEDFNMSVRGDYAKCFVCNDSADIFGFMQKFFGLDFKASMVKLNNDFSLGFNLDKPTEEDKKRIEQRKQELAKEKALKRQYFTDKHNWIDGRRYLFVHFGIVTEHDYLTFKHWKVIKNAN